MCIFQKKAYIFINFTYLAFFQISLFYLKINIFISFFINLNNYYIIKNDEKAKYSKNKQRIICDNN